MPQNASWDIVMVHHPNVTLTCSACRLTFYSTAVGRYAQLHELIQSAEWQQLHVEQYQYIYLPDSKVYHAADQIDRLVSRH